MSKRWSKLQSKLYEIIDPKVDFQIHCALYEMNSNCGWHGEKLPRYWITIGKDIIYDYPKMFDTLKGYRSTCYPWMTDIVNISDSIEEYINSSKDRIMYEYPNDRTGITNILRVCDRRVGKRRLRALLEIEENVVLKEIIEKRLRS